MDENGQPLFTLDMDAQRKAVFKVCNLFLKNPMIIFNSLGLPRRRE